MYTTTWIPIGPGALAVGPRPRLKHVTHLASAGCQCVVTLLAGNEGAKAIGHAVRAAGMRWVWLPLEDYSLPGTSPRILTVLQEVSGLLDAGTHVFIHCAAGIHRTGMITYALLRLRGLAGPDARAVLEQLRAVTAANVGSARRAWADILILKGAT